MAVHECKCGFRGKDAELVDAKCPRCGTVLVRGKAAAELKTEEDGGSGS